MKYAFVALLCMFVGLDARADASDYTIVKVDVDAQDLRIYWRDPKGQAFRHFDRLSSWLKTQNKKLVFGMNAGMYHADASPVGLLVIDGKQIGALNLSKGEGNFFIKPNGVFLLSSKGPQVVDAMDYPVLATDIRYATQSGPLLVKSGEINPAFGPLSKSRLIRNGVCASGRDAIFMISEKPVNLYDFAVFFRDELHCRDALYLDGVVSSLYSLAHGRDDFRATLGPLFAVVE